MDCGSKPSWAGCSIRAKMRKKGDWPLSRSALPNSRVSRNMDTSDLPLDGIVVLDLGQIFAGSYAGFLLAMGGATVIKIEPPKGDVLRHRVTMRGASGAMPFAMLNANKKGVTLDLKTEEGRDVLF